MSQEDYFRFGELPQLKAKALELPYTGTDIVFLIILPQEEQGLASVEEKLRGLDLNEISCQLSRPKSTGTAAQVQVRVRCPPAACSRGGKSFMRILPSYS